MLDIIQARQWIEQQMRLAGCRATALCASMGPVRLVGCSQSFAALKR
ncbi:hypothetical protein [Serratia sp. (in: enterobacteria)]